MKKDSSTVLSQDFYRELKSVFDSLAEDYKDKFSSIKNWKIINWKNKIQLIKDVENKISKLWVARDKAKTEEDFDELNKLNTKLDELIKRKEDIESDDSPELYFINIDKLRKLNFHDVKFLLDWVLNLAHDKLQDESTDKVNFCSLVFEKTKPNKRGLKMLSMKNIKTAPASKMKISLKKKDFIKI